MRKTPKGAASTGRDVGTCEAWQACRARTREPREATRLTADAMKQDAPIQPFAHSLGPHWCHSRRAHKNLPASPRRVVQKRPQQDSSSIVDRGSQLRSTIVGRGGHSSTLLIDSLAAKGAASVGLHWGSWQNPRRLGV